MNFEQILNHTINIQLLGLLIDILGAFWLSRGFIFKRSADIKSEVYGSANQKLKIDFGMSGNLYVSFLIQREEIRIGFILLCVGFLIQGVGITLPNMQITTLQTLIFFLATASIAYFSARYLTSNERVTTLHNRDERKHDPRLKKN